MTTRRIDGIQVEAKVYPTPYCDGSLGTGHSWSGTAHASTSSRTAAYTDIYSAGLNTAFDGDEGTVLVVAKGSGTWVWTDGVVRGMVNAEADSDNYVRIGRIATDNQIALDYKAGGTSEVINDTSITDADFHVWALTWSKSNNEVKAYVDGTQVGSTQTIAGTWSGSLDSAKTVIGALATTPSSTFSGNIALVMLSNKAWTANQIAQAKLP